MMTPTAMWTTSTATTSPAAPPTPPIPGTTEATSAGTIAAAGNNLLGIIGVNYQARIMALKASSDGDTLPRPPSSRPFSMPR